MCATYVTERPNLDWFDEDAVSRRVCHSILLLIFVWVGRLINNTQHIQFLTQPVTSLVRAWLGWSVDNPLLLGSWILIPSEYHCTLLATSVQLVNSMKLNFIESNSIAWLSN